MSFLCLAPRVENMSVSCVHFNSIIRDDSILLPTFSLLVEGASESARCRVLYDTGSQCNFIRGEIVENMGLESVEENVKLQINGFNSRKTVVTQLVKVPVKIIEIITLEPLLCQRLISN